MPIPTDLASFLDLIGQYGDAAYSVTFAYAASHGLLFTLFAGFAAQAGAFDFNTVVLVCWCGSFVGDVVRFWIGRRFGTRWLGSFPRIQRAVEIAARLADQYFLWMILLHRYPHGIRGVAGFAYGMSELPWLAFLWVNFVAAGLWSFAIVTTGYTFGRISEALMDDVSSWLGIGMLVAFGGLSWFLSKRLERAVERV